MKSIISFVAICAVIIAAVCIGFGAYVWHWDHRPHVLEIYCFALDKSGNSPGNLAVFIRTPDGHTILIDGGKSSSIVSTLGSIMPFYRRSIDTIISTNPDDSHITGLVTVLARYHVGKIVQFNAAVSSSIATSSTGSSTADSAYLALIDEIAKQKIPTIEVSAGNSIDFGDPAISAQVLFPPDPSSPDFQFSKTNAPVFAFLFRYGSTTVLLGGDLTKKEQEYVAGEIASSTDSSQHLLILPHAENVGTMDERFFEVYAPNSIVVLKKPASQSRAKNSPKKPPFDISSVSNLSVANLTVDVDVEFISDGSIFSEKKLK